MGNGIDTTAAPRKIARSEETAPSKVPGKSVLVETSARRLTGVPVVDDPACKPDVDDVDCWLTPDERVELRGQVYIMVKQAMDNGRDALLNVMLDIAIKHNDSTWWGGLAELLYRGVTSFLIGKLVSGWRAFQAAPSWLGKAIVEPKTLKMIERVTETTVKETLASCSTSFRTVLKDSAFTSGAPQKLRDLEFLRSTIQPAFGQVVRSLTTGAIARKFKDAELASLYHVYSSDDYSIESWEAVIRDIYDRYCLQHIDSIGDVTAPKEVSTKDAMTSKTMPGWRTELVTFVRRTDGSSCHWLVEQELDGTRMRAIGAPIDDDQYAAAEFYQKARNFMPPRVMPAEGTGDPKIDAWGRVSITPINEGASS